MFFLSFIVFFFITLYIHAGSCIYMCPYHLHVSAVVPSDLLQMFADPGNFELNYCFRSITHVLSRLVLNFSPAQLLFIPFRFKSTLPNVGIIYHPTFYFTKIFVPSSRFSRRLHGSLYTPDKSRTFPIFFLSF